MNIFVKAWSNNPSRNIRTCQRLSSSLPLWDGQHLPYLVHLHNLKGVYAGANCCEKGVQ